MYFFIFVMPDNFLQETGISAALGCATGFLWSTVAGQADLEEGKGWLFATTGCVGSAGSAASVYSISRYASEDRALARGITAGWFGLQSAASLTNWIGLKNNWHEKPAFNGIAFPLNYGAAPLTSTLSLILAAAGSTEDGFRGDPYFFSGTLVFPHNLCPGYSRAQLGAIGHHCAQNDRLDRQFHEVGHAVQSSILGDPGIIAVSVLNHIVQWNHNKLILEQWANDFSHQIDFSPYLREKFNLPKDSIIERDEFGLYRVQPRRHIEIEGRRYLPEPDLVFGGNMEGQWVLVEGTLAEPTTIEGFCFKKGVRLEYNGLGGVIRASYKETSERIFHFSTQRKNMPYHCEADPEPKKISSSKF